MTGPWSRRWRFVIRQRLLEAELLAGKRVVACATAAWESPEDLQHAIARLPAETSDAGEARIADIEIARPPLQRRALTDLPPLRLGALRALVRHQASRFFRGEPGALVTDVCRQRSADGSDELIGVAVDERLVTSCIAALEASGIAIRHVKPAPEESVPVADLLPPASRARRRAVRTRRLRWCIGAAATVAASVLAFRGVALAREDRANTMALDSLRGPVAALGRLRQEMDRAQAMLDAIGTCERDRAVVPHRLLRLVKGLPDSAVLTSVTIEADGGGRVTGLARRPLAVVADLDRLEAVENPRLEGGTIREPVQGRAWERFTIGFGVRSMR